MSPNTFVGKNGNFFFYLNISNIIWPTIILRSMHHAPRIGHKRN